MTKILSITALALFSAAPLMAQVEGEASDSAGKGNPIITPQVNEEIVPASARTVMGGSSNAIPWSWTPTRFQAVYRGTELPTKAYAIGCIGLRSNNRVDTGATLDMEIWLGKTTKTSATITSTFDSNYDITAKPKVLVLKRQMVKLADNLRNTDPGFFQYQIPLTTPYPWIPTTGENLLIEVKIYGNSNNNANFSMYLDNESGSLANASRVYASNNVNGATGTIGRNYAPCMSFFSKCKVNGDFTSYGMGCQGTGGFSGVVLPAANATKYANSSSYYPHGRSNMNWMQIMDASSVTKPVVCTGLAFRQASNTNGRTGGKSTLEIRVGKTTNGPMAFNINFAKNFNAGPSVVAFKGVVNLPTLTGRGTDAGKFPFQFPFTKPWVFAPASGENLAFQVTNTSTANIFSYADYNSSSAGKDMGVLYAFSATSTFATSALPGRGLVTGLMTAGGGTATPNLSNSGNPVIAKSYDVTLSLAKASSAAVNLLGFSDKKAGSQNLPLALDAFGAKGCSLLCSLDLLIPVPTDASGGAKVTFPVPNDVTLVGKNIFHQYFVLDSGANQLGLVFTNGGKALFGEQ